MAEKIIFKINLQLFAEGAAAGGEGAAAASTGGQAATGDTKADPAAATGENQTDPAVEDRKAAYAKFKEDFKKEYDEDVQHFVKDRLKKSNERTAELQKKIDAFAPLVDALAIRYGIKADDAAALLAAYEGDDSNYEKEAYANNSSVEQTRENHKLKRENASLTREKEAQAQEKQREEEELKVQETIKKWKEEAEQVKTVYPGFDFDTEVDNPDFTRLMRAGLDMLTAYEAAHHKEIMRGAMQYTAQKAAEKVANSVKANASRPTENGLSSQAAAVTRIDLDNLTPEQIAEYKRRARNGERIDFVNNF